MSVHLSDWPDVSGLPDAPELVVAMDRVRDVCTAGLNVRERENIRVRQPLGLLTVYGHGVTVLEEYADIIKDELNVKTIQFSEALDKVADLTCQVNFREAGKRLGPKMKAVGAAAKSGEWELVPSSKFEVRRADELSSTDMLPPTLALPPKEGGDEGHESGLESPASPEREQSEQSIVKASKLSQGQNNITPHDSASASSTPPQGGSEKLLVAGEMLEAHEFEIKLQAKDGITGAQALSTNDALVVLDLEITPELKAEGLARDVVRMIQQARKDADLNITDRIQVAVEAPDEITSALAANEDYVKEQTLATMLEFKPANGAKHKAEQDVEGAKVTIGFDVAA